MQKIKTNNRKRILLATLLVAILLIGSFVFAYTQKFGPFTESESDETELTDRTSDSENENEDEDIEGSTVSPDEERPQQRGDEIIRNPSQPPRSEGDVTISRIEATDQSVVIAAIVHGINSGNCTVTYSRGNERVTESSTIQQGPSYFGCQIEIPRSKFPVSGTWQTTLEARNDSAQARATSEVKL